MFNFIQHLHGITQYFVDCKIAVGFALVECEVSSSERSGTRVKTKIKNENKNQLFCIVHILGLKGRHIGKNHILSVGFKDVVGFTLIQRFSS